MKFQPVIILLLFHLLLSIITLYLIISRRTSLRKEHFIAVFILPVIGPSMALVIELLIKSGEQGKTPLNIEPLTPDEDILWTSLKTYHEKGNIVPLEEVILINDVKARRKFMLQTLYEDPLKYLDILMLAKNNEDVETSHYATTTISYTQRAFQVAVQELAIAVESNQDDIVLLDNYIETLEKYINSGLLEEHLLSNLRIVYQKTLDRKIDKVKNDKLTLIRKLRNSMELKEYAVAMMTNDILRKYWPEDEQTWIETIRMCVEGKDNEKLRETLEEIKQNKIIWTKPGREQISPWLNGISL